MGIVYETGSHIIITKFFLMDMCGMDFCRLT